MDQKLVNQRKYSEVAQQFQQSFCRCDRHRRDPCGQNGHSQNDQEPHSDFVDRSGRRGEAPKHPEKAAAQQQKCEPRTREERETAEQNEQNAACQWLQSVQSCRACL